MGANLSISSAIIYVLISRYSSVVAKDTVYLPKTFGPGQFFGIGVHSANAIPFRDKTREIDWSECLIVAYPYYNPRNCGRPRQLSSWP